MLTIVLALVAGATLIAGLAGQPGESAARSPSLRSPSSSPSAASTEAALASTERFLTAAPSQPVAPVRPATGVPGTTTAAAGNAGPVVARTEPLGLRIPAIGLSASVSGLGLNADRTVQVPTDYAKTGWFRPGPAPGQLGSAVILGHVDSYRGPAVFFRLRALRPGDRVDVTLRDRSIAHFTVEKVATYLKANFPARLVYGARGYSALHLVTCGGKFDTKTRSYLSNTVVYTRLVSVTPASAR